AFYPIIKYRRFVVCSQRRNDQILFRPQPQRGLGKPNGKMIIDFVEFLATTCFCHCRPQAAKDVVYSSTRKHFVEIIEVVTDDGDNLLMHELRHPTPDLRHLGISLAVDNSLKQRIPY